MHGKDKRAYKALGIVIGDKNRVKRKQRGLDRMVQRMKKIDSTKLRRSKKGRTKCSSFCTNSGSCACD